MKHLNHSLIIICFVLSGCFTIKTVNISQKTSLEHQLMGSFEPLTEEEMLLSSVRDEAQLNQGEELTENQRALQARRRQIFNRDDINDFKTRGCLGEAKEGQLVMRTCGELSPQDKQLLQEILEQETRDRETIISWVISQHDHLQASHRNQVIHIYRQFILSHSPGGTPFENAEGIWAQKESRAENP